MPNLSMTIIAGHLGRDAEFTTTKTGYIIGRCSVAVSQRVKQNNEWTEQTTWYPVVLLGERYDKIREWLTKGAAVLVQGRMQTRDWQDKEGQKRVAWELIADNVQLLGGRAGTSPKPAPVADDGRPPSKSDEDEDPLPF